MTLLHRLRPASLLVLATVALALGACGGDDEGAATTAATGNGADLAFASEMVPHHESAIDMAKVAERQGESQFVKDLAADIVAAQESEITTLTAAKRELEQAGVKQSDLGVPAHEMGMEMDSAMLEGAKPFDKAFIDMMVPHHQGAIRMARAEIAKGGDEDLKRLAQEIVDGQAQEIEAMNAFRTETYGGPSPAGGVPADDGGSATSGHHGS